MTRNDLPESDHIVRYVRPSLVEENGTANGAEFRLRPDRPDDTGLSVNWLETRRTPRWSACRLATRTKHCSSAT